VARLSAVGALVLLTAAGRLDAQEIIQAHVLDLTILEVQVIVTGTIGSDRVHCLLQDRAGRVRLGGATAVSAGSTSGRTTVLSIPLPLLDPGERQFAVAIVRGGTVLQQTEWRSLFPAPAAGRTP